MQREGEATQCKLTLFLESRNCYLRVNVINQTPKECRACSWTGNFCPSQQDIADISDLTTSEANSDQECGKRQLGNE